MRTRDNSAWVAEVLQKERAKIADAWIDYFGAIRDRDAARAERAFFALSAAIMSTEPSDDDMAWAIARAKEIVEARQ